jgi:hypothetical protein
MADIEMILAKDGNGVFRLWACRGAGKGCDRNRYRRQKTPCPDCYGPCDESMTMGELQDRLKAGDA